MRHLGEFKNPAEADTFAAYLLVSGIESHVDRDSDPAEIWIKDEDQYETARQELATFRENPSDPRYQQSVAEARKIAKDHQQRMKKIQKRIVHVNERGVGPNPRVTIGLIVISVIVALWTNFGIRTAPDHMAYRALQFNYVPAPASLELANQYTINEIPRRLASLSHGEVWRLVTPMFIHYGVIHIVFNMYLLAIFGSMIEKRYGWWKFLILVLLTSAVSNLVQGLVPVAWDGSPPYLFNNETLINNFGGMSGVGYGLFGFIWYKASFDPQSRLHISELNVLILMVWFFGCIFADRLAEMGIGLFPANVANWAHGGGLVAGVILAAVATQIGNRK